MSFLEDFNTDTLEAWRVGDRIVVKDAYDALLRKLVEYGSGKPSIDNGTLVYAGVGDGLLANLDMPVDGPTETWDITATSATNFTVVGTVTGALSDATVDVAYSNGDLSFTIIDGGTPFVSGDDWTMDVTLGVNSGASVDQWIIDRWDPNTLVPDDDAEYLHWHGEGDGTEAIYTGIRLVETPASQIWNWEMRSYTGFSAGLDFDAQPGQSAGYFTAMLDDDFRFWLILNARRYAMGWEVNGTTYHSLYQGFFLAYGSPNEYPYPICVLGEKDDQEAWNSTDANFIGIHETSSQANGAVRSVAGVWLPTIATGSSSAAQKWPNSSLKGSTRTVWDEHENFEGGDHQLFPIVFVTGAFSTSFPLLQTTLGEIEGVRIVTGFGNTPENVIAISGTDHIVFQDIFRALRQNFWTLEMS